MRRHGTMGALDLECPIVFSMEIPICITTPQCTVEEMEDFFEDSMNDDGFATLDCTFDVKASCAEFSKKFIITLDNGRKKRRMTCAQIGNSGRCHLMGEKETCPNTCETCSECVELTFEIQN